MTVAVADIKTRIRQITRRDNTTDYTDAELTAVLQEVAIDISKRTLCLKSSATGTLSADGTSITAPSDMVDSEGAIEALYMNSNLMDPITFDEWRVGAVQGYAYRDGTIYITPTSDNDRTYTLYYRAYHGTLSTNIEFKDEMKMAMVWGGCKKVYDDFFADSDTQSQKAEREYERELYLNAPVEPVIPRMRTTRE